MFVIYESSRANCLVLHVFNTEVINKGKHIEAKAFVIKVVFILVGMFIIGSAKVRAQADTLTSLSDTTFILPGDTALIMTGDSAAMELSAGEMQPDTLLSNNDTTAVKKPAGGGSPLSDVITYTARDSIDNDLIERKVYLYGDAEVNFGTITLKAARIVYDFEKYQVHAEGVQDSVGAWQGVPKFIDAGEEYDAFVMDYNFKSKKAIIKKVETEVIEGTLTGRDVKIIDGGEVIYIAKGEYCPCEDPNAKTRFKISKLKVIKDDKIVTGPGYLAFYGVPTPLAFPFGYFPNTEKKQAGLIVPSYGNAQRQGYFLNDLGFYLPIGDNVDTKFLTDLYSRGSWGVQNYTRYKNRYKYDGNFNVQYNKNRLGDRDLGNFQESTLFFVTWRHTQDPKAKPMSNFSADVNAGSSSTFQNNLNASQNDFLTNTFRSNIRYQQSFYDSPWSLAINAGHDQNSQTRRFNFTLPDIAINRARTFPLKGVFGNSAKQKWYEKFGLTYSSAFRNTLNVDEGALRLNNMSNLASQFRNGMQHRAAVTNSLKVGPITVNPSFNYTARNYFERQTQVRNPETMLFERDTVGGFFWNNDWSLSAALTTKIYGMYGFKSSWLEAIRHTLTPSLSFSYRPDFDTQLTGFYGPDGSLTSYSPYEGAIFGFSPAGEQGLVSFSLINNLEAKVLNRRDTTSKFTKIAILENLTVNGSYNLAADSLNLSQISVSGRTKVTKYANLVFRGSFDPYVHGVTSTGQVRRFDTFVAQRQGGLATFETGNIAVNANGLGSAMFARKGAGEVVQEEEGEQELDDGLVRSPLMDFISGFRVPWTLNFAYSFDARRVRTPIVAAEGYFIEDSIAIVQSIQMNGSFDFFKRVKVNFTTGYDFLRKELTPTTLLITVDLNCWELNARVVPFGIRRMYNISLNIKSTMLRDLKLERNRNLGPEDNFFL
jgi:hypothetical protein